MDEILLKLFITGQNRRSDFAMENMTGICEELPEHKLVIIDVIDHPDLAEKANVRFTPTLIKESPLPVQRIIGDLYDKRKVLSYLNLKE